MLLIDLLLPSLEGLLSFGQVSRVLLIQFCNQLIFFCNSLVQSCNLVCMQLIPSFRVRLVLSCNFRALLNVRLFQIIDNVNVIFLSFSVKLIQFINCSDVVFVGTECCLVFFL
jgi:hypothetical protein